MSALADIIAQETRDGRLIVRFLLSAMEGDYPDFLPCHRIDAARLLVKLGFDQAQSAIDRANAARPAPSGDSGLNTRHSGFRRNPGAELREAQDAAHQVRAQLAQIVREETDDGRVAVRFLIDAMQGEFPDFKPCHRLSAAKELLHRGFDYVPDDDAQEAAEPEPTPEELGAERRRAEDIEFSLHSPVYYDNIRYPCVCEDRLHDCKGNVLSDEERANAIRKGPGMQSFIGEPDRIDAFVARYAEYLTRWNAEHPENPINIDRIHWNDKRWQHLNPPDSISPYTHLRNIRGP